MPVDYPTTLPSVLASKRVSKVPRFSMAQPRRGAPYVEPTGTDTPTIFEVEWLLLPEDALALREWVEDTLQGGTLQFRMPLRTEDGERFVTGNFMPDGLLDRQREGALWRYRATIVARNGRGEPPPTAVGLGVGAAAAAGLAATIGAPDLDDTLTIWDSQTTGLGATITGANRQAAIPSSHGSASVGTVSSTRAKSSGKWYIEFEMAAVGSNLGAVVRADVGIGSVAPPLTAGATLASGTGGGLTVRRNGDIRASGSVVGSTSMGGGDVFMFAYDADNDRAWVGRNGSWLLSGDPAAGTSPAVTGLNAQMYPGFCHESGAGAYTVRIRGRDDLFSYTPPTGFSAWSE